jgi:cytochrome c peroxidase
MTRYVIFLFSFFIILFNLSFSTDYRPTTAQEVKKKYLQKLDTLTRQVEYLRDAVTSDKYDSLQKYFFSLRKAYKETETITEYFYKAFAQRLNGPPIPYFEESDPYILINDPYGMQVIEGLLFPEYHPADKKELLKIIDEMLQQLKDLTVMNEPFEFNDANVFDAFMEEAYRITALGLVGFDSQTAQYSLQENAAALKGLQDFISFYKPEFDEKMPGKYQQLKKLFEQAILFIGKENSFNKFDRLSFITNYLNPVTKIIGEYKLINNLADNPSGVYYSSIKKANTLFSAGAFDPNRFMGDFTATPQKAEFGRQLFFDPRLSSNNKRSCSGCHQPDKAFTDGLKTSEALDGHSSLSRNAPTIWNAALQRNLFYDSRSRSLEDQVLQVLNNSKEMHGSATAVADKILQVEKYRQMYSDAYPGAKIVPGTPSGEDAVKNICNAIASYERTLISLNSKFDKHIINGTPVLNKGEANGFNLFMGKAKCGSCHFMPLFSGAKPPRYYYIESEVLGVPANAKRSKAKLDADSGRYLITQSPVHLFSFKTPSLRNVELTAPYMHNGIYKTLEEVVDFYNNGGGRGLGIAPQNQTLPFEKLNLTSKEKKDLIVFMKALTDTLSVQKTED